MLNVIVNKLDADFPAVKAGAFGDEKLPRVPYVIVKQEQDLAGRGKAYRIVAHFSKGQQTDLEDYIRGTVGASLDNFTATDRHGNKQKLYSDSDDVPSDLRISNDDGTISMERVYWMPDRL